MPDIVRQDDPVAVDIERLARPEQFFCKLRRKELATAAARAVKQHHRVIDLAAPIAMWSPECGVVDAHFVQMLAGAKRHIARDEISIGDFVLRLWRRNLRGRSDLE